MAFARAVEITPSAPALIKSVRGLGYSPETALSDLIDNSIAAGAEAIELDIQWNEGNPCVAILDNGRGLTDRELSDALRLGGVGPEAVRDDSDLGRFGMGLKSASLSQCRRVTVVTRHSGETSALVLDVDVITEQGWVAPVPDPLPEHPYVARLLAQMQGTIVIWDRMDALGGLMGLDKESFYIKVQDIRAHIGMVFHRFLGGDARRLYININGRAVKPWDPFLTVNPATTEMREETIRFGGSAFRIKPYVLPHRDRFSNDSEYEAAGGPGGWGARQGFYVYRGKRLLVPGSWLGLGGIRAWTREQSSRLARIRIDLPIDMDTDWRIDVRKSQARPPGVVRARLTAIAARAREQAREVFAWRGRGPKRTRQTTEPVPVWLGYQDATGTRYRINREHPAVVGFKSRANNDPKLLDALLTVIERSVPIERIWLDTSESEGSVPPELGSEQLEELVSQLASLSTLLPVTMPIPERVELLLCNLPEQQPELRERLTRRLEAAA
ncbi:ATP-binding protein [Ahrensia marina]|uniref:ATP-binding protein n=1 Tax=Ahrensia marina TaxID=1514904 RepID=UPI0035D11D25